MLGVGVPKCRNPTLEEWEDDSLTPKMGIQESLGTPKMGTQESPGTPKISEFD